MSGSLKAVYALEEALSGTENGIGGKIELDNTQPTTQAGHIVMELLDGDTIADGGYAEYSVPPYTKHEYDWSGLAIDKPGAYAAASTSAINSATTDQFRIDG